MDEQTRHQFRGRPAAASAAARVLGWPPVVLWIIGVILVVINVFDAYVLTVLMGIGLLFGPLIVPAAEFIGWFSCRFFGNSTISATRLAIAMALLVDFVVLGWILVIIHVASA